MIEEEEKPLSISSGQKDGAERIQQLLHFSKFGLVPGTAFIHDVFSSIASSWMHS